VLENYEKIKNNVEELQRDMSKILLNEPDFERLD